MSLEILIAVFCRGIAALKAGEVIAHVVTFHYRRMS